MGSESALEGKKMGSLYSAAKFGLRGFAQSVREECRNSDVRVSIVNPGLVRTPFFENLNFGKELCLMVAKYFLIKNYLCK